jgi:hypothetical protein
MRAICASSASGSTGQSSRARRSRSRADWRAGPAPAFARRRSARSRGPTATHRHDTSQRIFSTRCQRVDKACVQGRMLAAGPATRDAGRVQLRRKRLERRTDPARQPHHRGPRVDRHAAGHSAQQDRAHGPVNPASRARADRGSEPGGSRRPTLAPGCAAAARRRRARARRKQFDTRRDRGQAVRARAIPLASADREAQLPGTCAHGR